MTEWWRLLCPPHEHQGWRAASTWRSHVSWGKSPSLTRPLRVFSAVGGRRPPPAQVVVRSEDIGGGSLSVQTWPVVLAAHSLLPFSESLIDLSTFAKMLFWCIQTVSMVKISDLIPRRGRGSISLRTFSLSPVSCDLHALENYVCK